MVENTLIGVIGIVAIIGIFFLTTPSLTGHVPENVKVYENCLAENQGQQNSKIFCMCKVSQDFTDCARYFKGEWSVDDFQECLNNYAGRDKQTQYNACKEHLKPLWIS